MAKKKMLEPGHSQYWFHGVISIYTVAKMKDLLIAELEENDILDFDLSEIEKFDTAGFQFFLYLSKLGEKKGKKINVKNANQEVNRIFELYHAFI